MLISTSLLCHTVEMTIEPAHGCVRLNVLTSVCRPRNPPPMRTEYRITVENLSSRVSWQVKPRNLLAIVVGA